MQFGLDIVLRNVNDMAASASGGFHVNFTQPGQKKVTHFKIFVGPPLALIRMHIL